MNVITIGQMHIPIIPIINYRFLYITEVTVHFHAKSFGGQIV